MSVNSKNLSVLAYSNGFTLWHYKTTETKSVVGASGYFNSVAHIFNVGDLIVASVNVDGEPETVLFMVSAVGNGSATVSNIIQ